MPLSPQERRESNRRNAARSTGPRTTEGKERSRTNALKHGLRAVVLPLPGEDPEALAQREREWVEHYRPESPAAAFLMSECARATIITDRTHRHHVAVVSEQVRRARHEWDQQRETEIKTLRALLKTDPGEAIDRLTRTAHGCQFLIDAWNRLKQALDRNGFWTDSARDEALRLLGHAPKIQSLRDSATAWWVYYHAVNLMPKDNTRYHDYLFHSSQFPVDFLGVIDRDAEVDADEARGDLHDMIDGSVQFLEAERARLHEEIDAPSRAEAGERALLIRDPDQARLVLRYHAEARSTFHRAYGDLLKTLQRDAESDSETAANGSPNEANFAAKSLSEPDLTIVCECREEVGEEVFIVPPTADGTPVDGLADLGGAGGPDGPLGRVEVEAVRVPVKPDGVDQSPGVPFEVVDERLVVDVDGRVREHVSPVLDDSEVTTESAGDVGGIIAPEHAAKVAHPARKRHVAKVSPTVNDRRAWEEGPQHSQEQNVVGHLVRDPRAGRPREGIEAFEVDPGESADRIRIKLRERFRWRTVASEGHGQVPEHPAT